MGEKMKDIRLTEIPGVGDATATTLGESGFPDVEAVARASEKELAAAPGFGPLRAATVIAAARAVLAASDTSADEKPGKKRKDKKNKDKKKDKKKKKKREKNKTKKKKDRKKKKKEKKDGRKKRR
jgi:hypothetical protein